jgi:DNA-binding LacI/PurR family transcriptional regulator
MAEAAIELLMADLRNGADNSADETERVLGHQLIVRDSASPVSAAAKAEVRQIQN